jgi:cell division protein FtsQ
MSRAAESGRRQPVWAFFLTGLLLVGMATMAVTANGWKRDFRVLRVQSRGNTLVADSEIVRMAAIPRGAKLFDIDLNGIRMRVQRNPFLKSVSVTRELPDGIVILVTERTPVAALVLDRILYIDAEGYVLPPVRSRIPVDLPVFTGEFQAADCQPGQRIGPGRLREALEILTTAARIGNDLYHLVSEVHCAGDSMYVLYTTDSGVPVMLGRGSIAEKLVKFDGFWKQIVMQQGAARLKTIDLRFADQVVVRWDEGPGGAVQ